jgi:hypothetical protein
MREVIRLDKEKRTTSVMVKLTAEEKKMLESLAKRRGQPLSVCIRTLIYEKYRSEVI